MGGPPSKGMEIYKPKVRTGWRVRASTGSSLEQMLSYLGIEKADMPQTTHGRMGGLTFPQSGMGRGFGPALRWRRASRAKTNQPDPR
jgi:hypothetical protein